ncbi:hypothetical protein L1285_22230 [Pseudoalteromonas sp. DL2-H2.2]|uniref:hypothetical protein n=1 Tax=Pseudoalteromonas sp. DL2-H2.2 TaxID=2908889 RepID=UPI001F3F73B7|nr:hypothetical protein [Pseudoalteromonas sp. DL2-H2.2]MCF2911026.1 hypothetical protein [Pseudoalteromonas sp. DL2-H2.2]
MNNLLKTLVVALGTFTAVQSHAAPLNEQALKACTMVENDLKRLGCFDQVMAGQAPQASSLKSKPADAPAPAVAANTQNDFGLEHIPKIAENNNELEGRITKVSKSPLGKVTVTLDNGQVWKQTGAESLRLRSGDEVVISRAALSSFLMRKVGSNRATRVKRQK